LDLAIRLAHGLKLELSNRLECLNAASGNDRGAASISINQQKGDPNSAAGEH
jgi:hypothetical protein